MRHRPRKIPVPSIPANGLSADLEAKLWAMADKLRGNVDPASTSTSFST